MNLKTRVCVTYQTSPYRNLALEETLLRRIEPGVVVLYLWQNDHTIVIGRNQDAWRECRVELFEREGGSLARRLSGGGAVYHDMGNQNFTFLAHANDYDAGRQTEVIRLAARAFGIDAVRSGRNDILADERKFSGNAFYRSGDLCYHHGTILIDSDMPRLERYLNPSPEKLAGKGIASVRSRVVNLRELSPGITPEGMRAALREAFASVYGSNPETIDEAVLESAKLNELTVRYASAEWRLGTPRDYTAKHAKRLSFGEIDIRMTVREGIIEQAAVYSDAMDADLAPRISAALLGVGYDAQGMISALSAALGGSPDAADEISAFLAESIPE